MTLLFLWVIRWVVAWVCISVGGVVGGLCVCVKLLSVGQPAVSILGSVAV